MADIKALVLLSGGLDSMLAAKLLKESGVEITGLSFKSCFFGTKKAETAAAQIGISIKIVDFSRKHLEMLKKPAHGYGSAANPCIDCHLLMLTTARNIMETEGYDFVATGEVLGERPFSQNRQALMEIAELSGLKDRLLRPLSAKLLPKTLPEINGWVKDEFLLNIGGRGRQRQFELAKKYNLTFPQPGGGCPLTEKDFGNKVFELLKHRPEANGSDAALLSIGRHFWLESTLVVLGRDKNENEKLADVAQKNDCVIVPQFPAPTALIRGKIDEKIIEEAKKMIIEHSKKLPEKAKLTKFTIKK